MTIDTRLHEELLRVLDVSASTLSRRAQALARAHGPMTADEARHVLAHEAGIDLGKFGLTSVERERVRILRAGMPSRESRSSGAPSPQVAEAPRRSNKTIRSSAAELTPAARFASRGYHSRVVRASRRPYVNGLPQDAVLRALKSVNNRVKKLASSHKDGQDLMGSVFGDSSPSLQATDLITESEQNEHAGYRFLLMGAMRGLRNPRAHEDHWAPDDDDVAVLETLAVASLLHRFIDRCEDHLNV